MSHSAPAAAVPIVLRDVVCPDDRAAVRRIVASTRFFTPAEIEVAVELVEERLAKGERSGYEFLFADDAEATVGFACFGPIACTAASHDLYWIAVDARWQGRGVGRLLLAEAEQRIRAAGGRRVFVETSSRALYAPTRAFYAAHGYRQAARICDFYADADDKIVYVKAL